ncbi:MAG: 50S ribosomal protein L22 [Pseudodesulfovibrio sp.]|uniref:Large ribosomal subunit protein uL22 n=1 Tax=Pseudodesulfovibrio aespoeensis (strain ATCC 700646 / DSM 10631 / Aspo-2) TaxID=643562 RepID=E6VT96_PSEA9|nr:MULTISPECIES: 50S ribosomal protein L22 [Pseudodesulfovibrio]MBU4245003.1 50S ribosomal protein L22 [Pseudomonadota bacterium]ADU63255.1 ribosomal protein L22 [Pseudodesulfovibrio aespoeensis Aspo-2]MBU4379011.1 50S ribosomal protein L22 [Pseudomonadota bacterium]MBU4475152.1 50S ribosomal protein L22 [Pseudomonadota bacterium]MBU4516174.1 50S ribosomal protein L22 [Pseudomonadota bacterium]
MEAKAVAKYIRVSPRKTRIVAENIKGKGVEDALNILRFTPKKAAKILSKVLFSAISNAEQMPGVDVDSLIVDTVMVNEGPSWKRIQPRAMGRAYRIRKRTSHITIVVKEM